MAYQKKESLRNLLDRKERTYEELRDALKGMYDAFNVAVAERTPKAWAMYLDSSMRYERLFDELVRLENKICILNTVANVSNIK